MLRNLSKSELWIRIHFLRIRHFFSMQIRIQLHFKCRPGSSFTKFEKITFWRVLFCWRKHEKISKKYGKHPGSLCRFTSKIWINLQLLPIFVNFSVFLLKMFSPLDRNLDSHIECGSGSRRENECRSMRIRTNSPVQNAIFLYHETGFRPASDAQILPTLLSTRLGHLLPTYLHTVLDCLWKSKIKVNKTI